MECDCARLTVCFEAPFWVAVYEREEAGRLTVCRQVFGAEPRDGEVYQWLLASWRTLAFSPAVALERREAGRLSPKRASGRPGPRRSSGGWAPGPSRPSSSSGRSGSRRVRHRAAVGTRRRRSGNFSSAKRRKRRSAGGTEAFPENRRHREQPLPVPPVFPPA